jgi:exodeoxyribonuclease VII large subunit
VSGRQTLPPAMPSTYLTTTFRDRELVKSLGARWDALARRWFVPEGRDLAPFAAWLPPDGAMAPGAGPLTSSTAMASAASMATMAPLPSSAASLLPADDASLPAVPERSVSLSSLLAGVAQAVAAAFRAGAWTTAEVLKADVRRGHVYLELAERDAQGVSVAQARGMIWSDTANRIVPAFEQATGMVLGAGIKLLLRARPTLHPLYGLSLVIDAIDPDYTLGDLEARKREIRQRLQREGLFELNRQLPAPWDFNQVLVVAPQGAAGLGDFNAEAQRLARHGLCQFTVVHSRFQGEGAAAEVLAALNQAMDACRARAALPDAVAIIRGGGAVNDLAWLNDYALARGVCELEVPVFTGIGHERDNTVLDEVAHTRFDTPSKVIQGIEQHIVRRAREAQAAYADILGLARQQLQRSRQSLEQAQQSVRQLAQRNLQEARELSRQALGTVHGESQRLVRAAALASGTLYTAVGHRAMAQVAQARQRAPALLADVSAQARQTLHAARADSLLHLRTTLDHSRLGAAQARLTVDRTLSELKIGARQQLDEARHQSQALVREVAGQGPDKALDRGFAMLRRPGPGGRTVTRAAHVACGAPLDIQLQDGRLNVQVLDVQRSSAVSTLASPTVFDPITGTPAPKDRP